MIRLNKKGFSIIELLIVAVMVGVFVLVVAKFMVSVQKSEKSFERLDNLETLVNELDRTLDSNKWCVRAFEGWFVEDLNANALLSPVLKHTNYKNFSIQVMGNDALRLEEKAELRNFGWSLQRFNLKALSPRNANSLSAIRAVNHMSEHPGKTGSLYMTSLQIDFVKLGSTIQECRIDENTCPKGYQAICQVEGKCVEEYSIPFFLVLGDKGEILRCYKSEPSDI